MSFYSLRFFATLDPPFSRTHVTEGDVMSVWFLFFSVGLLFLLSFQIINMKALKGGVAKAAADRARNNPKDEARRVQAIILRMERIDPKANLTQLRTLADKLLNSEPSGAPAAIERELAKSMDELEAIVPIFMADANLDLSVRGVLSEAVETVDSALKARSKAILT